MGTTTLALSAILLSVNVSTPSLSFALTLVPSTGRGSQTVRENAESATKERSLEIWFPGMSSESGLVTTVAGPTRGY